jgi:hypothetical protein
MSSFTIFPSLSVVVIVVLRVSVMKRSSSVSYSLRICSRSCLMLVLRRRLKVAAYKGSLSSSGVTNSKVDVGSLDTGADGTGSTRARYS